MVELDKIDSAEGGRNMPQPNTPGLIIPTSAPDKETMSKDVPHSSGLSSIDEKLKSMWPPARQPQSLGFSPVSDMHLST